MPILEVFRSLYNAVITVITTSLIGTDTKRFARCI